VNKISKLFVDEVDVGSEDCMLGNNSRLLTLKRSHNTLDLNVSAINCVTMYKNQVTFHYMYTRGGVACCLIGVAYHCHRST